MGSTAQAYIIFHCSSRELQARAGFDGWVALLRDEFDTEDQAWPQERLRLASVAKRKMRRLESGGVELDMLQLVTSCHLLLEPPSTDREEERIWCIEFFRGKMYDFVVCTPPFPLDAMPGTRSPRCVRVARPRPRPPQLAALERPRASRARLSLRVHRRMTTSWSNGFGVSRRSCC